MVNAAAPLIITSGLCRTFGTGDTRVTALDDANIEVHSREFTVVLGPSGSGKSTLLNLLGGMDAATAGTLQVGGLSIESLSERDLTRYRREQVGFVFQFYNLIPTLTARENVALAAELVMSRAEADTRASAALAEVGLEHRLNHFPRHLSGGEMQRVAIARALAKVPRLLLCDEPSGALDSATGHHVLAHLQRTARNTDTAVVVVTHEQSLADAADRVIHLRDGRVIEQRVVRTPQTLSDPESRA